MPHWVSITLDDLHNAKVAALVEALRLRALAGGQTERAADITQRVVDRVRRKIASNTKNRVDADLTKVPNGLKDDTIKLIIADLKNALEEDLTSAESAELLRINADLNRIASGLDTVDEPDDPIDAPVEDSSGTPSVTYGRRERLNRSKGI